MTPSFSCLRGNVTTASDSLPAPDARIPNLGDSAPNMSDGAPNMSNSAPNLSDGALSL